MPWRGDNHIHVFYDDQCSLCQRFKNSAEHLCQSQFVFHPLHSKETQRDFPGILQDQLEEKLHVISEDGVWLQGSEAFNHLASHCSGVERLRWLIQSEAGKKASEYFYKMSDRLRHSLRKYCRTC